MTAPAPALPGLVLVAHGSARSGASAEPVLALARALAGRGFPEVRTAFWKEEPFLHQGLDATRSPRLVVLPLFLAQGYFSRVVVPRELGLRYGHNPLGGRSVRLLPPLGADPALDALALDRARAALAGAAPAETALVVLGHGTPRDPGSADAVLGACARLRATSGFARVLPAFLDQEPTLAQAIAEAGARPAVVVPFLMASGFHGAELAGRGADSAGREVRYAEPIGTHPGLAALVERLARAAAEDEFPLGLAPAGPLDGAEAALGARLAREPRAVLLQVEVRALAGQRYALRHAADAPADDGALEPIAGRDALLALARRTDSGAHRPLRTAADLRRGWRFVAEGTGELIEALVALYGPAVVHWHQGERRALPVLQFDEVARRQSGMYEGLHQTEPAAVREGIRRVCEGLPCLRARLWGPAPERPRAPEGAELAVPCPAPCPILLGAVLDAGLDAGPDEP